MRERRAHFDCGNCEYWLSRHVAAGLSPEDAVAAHERALAVGSPIPEGRCHRYPQAVPTARHDLCGEHSQFEAERRDDLAAAIAHRLASKES